MSIAIRGIRIDGIDIRRKEDGHDDIDGDYSLISTSDKVLAKQGFNGYNEIKVGLSGETVKALNDFMAGIKKDVENTLGLTQEE